MRDLHFASATELAARIRARELSPVELMRSTLDRIAALNPRLNAFVSLRPADELLAEAKAVAAWRQGPGRRRRPAEQARPWDAEWPAL
jgi:amidase